MYSEILRLFLVKTPHLNILITCLAEMQKKQLMIYLSLLIQGGMSSIPPSILDDPGKYPLKVLLKYHSTINNVGSNFPETDDTQMVLSTPDQEKFVSITPLFLETSTATMPCKDCVLSTTTDSQSSVFRETSK